MKDELKCMVKRLFLLCKLREHLAALEVEYENAKRRMEFYRGIGNTETAKIASKTLNAIHKSIKAVQKEIEKLEKVCS